MTRINDVAISIIVPVYNSESTIRKCIDSILNQTFRYFEIILVDDGSTDSSGEICDAYSVSDNRVKVIHTSNNGVSEARQTGIDFSSADYIAFVDSDDWIDPEMIEGMYSKCIAQNLEIVECDFMFEGESSNQIKYSQRDSQDKALGEIISNNWGVVWNKLFSKSLIDRYGLRFPSGISASEDYIFVVKCMALASQYAFVPECYYHYRCDNRLSLSKAMSPRVVSDGYTATCQVIDFLSKHSLYDKYAFELIYRKLYIKNQCVHFGLRYWQRCYPEVREYIWDFNVKIPLKRRIIYYLLQLWGQIFNKRLL